MAQRTRLAECLAYPRDGDVLMVTKPDRLARSTAELLAIDVFRRGKRALAQNWCKELAFLMALRAGAHAAGQAWLVHTSVA